MDKLRQRQEITAYRIVRRNVLKITNGIPFNNMSKYTFEALVNSNVTVSQIKEMFLEIYTTLGKPQYKRSQKDGIDFDFIISQWLNTNAGLRIVSVHQTLIDAIVGVISKVYERMKKKRVLPKLHVIYKGNSVILNIKHYELQEPKQQPQLITLLF